MTTVTDTTDCPAWTPEEVMELLRDQASLYGRLESCASRQRSLITADDSSLLLSLLAARQKLATELTQISTRLAPVRRDWSSYRERLSSIERAEADRLLAETSECLGRVIESDEQDARLLSARKRFVAEGLRATHATGQALSAYRAPVQPGPRTERLDEAS